MVSWKSAPRSLGAFLDDRGESETRLLASYAAIGKLETRNDRRMIAIELDICVCLSILHILNESFESLGAIDMTRALPKPDQKCDSDHNTAGRSSHSSSCVLRYVCWAALRRSYPSKAQHAFTSLVVSDLTLS